jgi:hypothetical protein
MFRETPDQDHAGYSTTISLPPRSAAWSVDAELATPMSKHTRTNSSNTTANGRRSLRQPLATQGGEADRNATATASQGLAALYER